MSRPLTSWSLDFDHLRMLADEDPEAFEQLRLDAIEAAIGRASPRQQPQLRRLQWRIEQIRRRAPTPLSACISLSGLMWDSLLGEQGLLEIIRHPPGPSCPIGTASKILPFPGKPAC